MNAQMREALFRKHLFIKYFDRTIRHTIEAMQKAGHRLTVGTGQQYFKDPAVRMAIRIRTDRLGGVLTKLELQQLWSRVAEGVEADWMTRNVPTMVDEEYEDEEGQKHTRRRVKWIREAVAVPPSLSDRLKASELLGKSVLAFVERIELSGDLNISINDVLDEDLKIDNMKRAELGEPDAEFHELTGIHEGVDQKLLKDADELAKGADRIGREQMKEYGERTERLQKRGEFFSTRPRNGEAETRLALPEPEFEVAEFTEDEDSEAARRAAFFTAS